MFRRSIVLSLTAIALVAFCGIASAADDVATSRPTFTKDVLPLLQENCQTCHRPSGSNFSGMVAPMSFMNYKETRPWAKAIAKKVEAREMPPWDAAPEYNGVFSNERTLTDEEISMLVRWVDTGAARGNPADAPAPIVWADNGGAWSIGKPDFIVTMPEPFFVGDDVQDLYVTHKTTITEDMLSEPRYIKAVEFKSGSEIVHHIIASPLGGMAPGSDPGYTPEGYGKIIRPGTEVGFDMHYHKEAGAGTGRWDQSSIGVVLYPKGTEMKYRMGGGPSLISPGQSFEIPPGNSYWPVGAATTLEKDTQVLRLSPHLHLRGAAIRYTAIYPDGAEEILLDVPKYDFNWQTGYLYKEPKLLPAGTRIEVLAIYDNSEERAQWAGFNSDRPVRWGLPTTDEMMHGFLSTSDMAPAPALIPEEDESEAGTD